MGEYDHILKGRILSITEDLLDRRTVVLAEINEKTALDVISRLLILQMESSEVINLLIHSPGGDGKAAFLICDFIEHVLKAPVRGIAVGSCDSAATFVMLHCQERIATPHSEFLIHSGMLDDLSLRIDKASAKNLEQLMYEIRQELEKVIPMYMKKLGKTKEEIEGYISRGDQDFGRMMSAKEACEIGLVQEIVEGKLDIF